MTKMFAEMTIAEKFVAIADGEITITDEVKAFLYDRAEKSKKGSGSSKPTKAQIEMSEVTIPAILGKMAELDRPVTVSELAKALDLSQSKVTSALTIVKGTKVTRAEVKGRPYYSLV